MPAFSPQPKKADNRNQIVPRQFMAATRALGADKNIYSPRLRELSFATPSLYELSFATPSLLKITDFLFSKRQITALRKLPTANPKVNIIISSNIKLRHNI
jgi:hypothetical protein